MDRPGRVKHSQQDPGRPALTNISHKSIFINIPLCSSTCAMEDQNAIQRRMERYIRTRLQYKTDSAGFYRENSKKDSPGLHLQDNRIDPAISLNMLLCCHSQYLKINIQQPKSLIERHVKLFAMPFVDFPF